VEQPVRRTLDEVVPEASDDLQAPADLIKDGKVIEGKDGWLFLANDGNGVLEQHTGTRRLTDEQVEQWRDLLVSRTALAERHGAHYVFLVAPDAHGVYPENLPANIVLAPTRSIHQLIDAVEEEMLGRFIYPLDELRAARVTRDVFPLVDSHWNQFGAFVAYHRLLDELEQIVAVRRLPEEEIAFLDVYGVGDLSYKLTEPREGARLSALLRAGSSRLVEDNGVLWGGAYVVTECPDAPDTTCLLFGDSYTYDILKFLAESFRRLVFAHSSTFDATLIEREQPDLVLSLMAERFMIVVPEDAGAPTLEEKAGAKREEGETREELPFWPPPTMPSLLTVELVRRRLLERGSFRDAVLVTTVAYAGLRPAEIQRLQWRDLTDAEAHVRARESSEADLDLGPERRVSLVAPLREDLETLHEKSGGGEDGLVFPGPGGGDWNKGEWLEWNQHTLQPAARASGMEGMRPYRLHDVFCSLLIHQGLGQQEVARQAGYPSDAIDEKYRYLFWIAKGAGTVPAERRIRVARVEAASASAR
jgi:integrase